MSFVVGTDWAHSSACHTHRQTTSSTQDGCSNGRSLTASARSKPGSRCAASVICRLANSPRIVAPPAAGARELPLPLQFRRDGHSSHVTSHRRFCAASAPASYRRSTERSRGQCSSVCRWVPSQCFTPWTASQTSTRQMPGGIRRGCVQDRPTGLCQVHLRWSCAEFSPRTLTT